MNNDEIRVALATSCMRNGCAALANRMEEASQLLSSTDDEGRDTQRGTLLAIRDELEKMTTLVNGLLTL